MSETGEQQQQQRLGSSMNPKIASDSGYGSNKSTQRRLQKIHNIQ